MNQLTVVVIIGFILVGGIALFSIFIQQDSAIAAVERVINPNLHCLDKWDYLDQTIEKDPDAFSKFMDAGCNYSFRDWMPEGYPGWDGFVGAEKSLISNCKLYVKGELVLKEWEEPIWKEKGCENVLKRFD